MGLNLRCEIKNGKVIPCPDASNTLKTLKNAKFRIF